MASHPSVQNRTNCYICDMEETISGVDLGCGVRPGATCGAKVGEWTGGVGLARENP